MSGAVLLLICWCGTEGLFKHRKLDIRGDVGLASLSGPPGFLSRTRVQGSGGLVTEVDVAAWPYSVTLQCTFSSFLSSLHWPADSGDLGHYGVSFLALMILLRNGRVTRCLVRRLVGPSPYL